MRGLTEDLAAYDVVLGDRDVDHLQERPRFGIVAQTTQPVERLYRIAALVGNRFPRSEVEVMNTVCLPTRLRQGSAEELARASEVVLVVGGARSNNTRELAATCRRHCARVFHVQSAADVRAAHEAGKTNALMGMEGGHMIDDSLAVLRMYAALGVRYLTLTHSEHTNWADSSGAQSTRAGLTAFGKDVVRELNRLGVMVDVSHVADKTF